MLNLEFKQAELTANNLIESVIDYIIKNDCLNISIDISKYNLMDAVKIAALCATFHFEKYPEGKMDVIVKSPQFKSMIAPLSLGNINVIEK